jgi:hypothetical protein
VFSQMMVGRQDPAKLENEVKTLRRKKCQSFFSYLCKSNAMAAFILISCSLPYCSKSSKTRKETVRPDYDGMKMIWMISMGDHRPRSHLSLKFFFTRNDSNLKSGYSGGCYRPVASQAISGIGGC